MSVHVLRLVLILAPGAALAHPGHHVHPHGAESTLTLMAVATLVAAGVWLIMRDN